MYPILLSTHSGLRYIILLLLVAVIVKSLVSFISNKPYSKVDDMLGIMLFSFAHTQFLVGAILYFVSPNVQFNDHTMSDHNLRFWTVEHVTMMLGAIVLITVARMSTRNLTDARLRFKRLLIYNSLALLIIIVAILMSGRGFFASSAAI